MTSKKVLERLNNFISREKHINSERNKIINEYINTIKQDLERLEKLEIENRNNEKVVSDSAKLINKNLELQARLETLEKENRELKETIEIRKQMNINLIDFGTKLKQENEKLKKAIENEIELLIERRETFWFTDSYDEYAVVNEIIEELKEVLGNEIR